MLLTRERRSDASQSIGPAIDAHRAGIRRNFSPDNDEDLILRRLSNEPERAVNVLAKWYGDYRAWEDGYIAMLDAINDGRPVDPAWMRTAARRKLVDKVRCDTPIERTQMRDLIWLFRGWRGWAAVGAIVTVDCLVGWALSVARPGKFGTLEAMAVVNLLVLCLGIGIVATWLHPGRFARYRGRALFLVPPLALVGALFGATIATFVNGENPLAMFQRIGKQVLIAGLGFGVVYGGLLGLIVVLRIRELRALNAKLVVDAEKAKLGTQLTESRLRLLQAQIEPHFLFNTLGAVQQLAEGPAPQAAALTGHLIRFLRNSMGSFGERPVSLADELTVIESYLQIMQSRLGERLTVRIDVPDALRRCSLLPTMLLTFVENAIKHGIEPSSAGGEIRVSARRANSMLSIEVADTGVGMSETLGDGNGLRNVREQLALAYGDVATLVLVENEPHGLIVSLTIPCEAAT